MIGRVWIVAIVAVVAALGWSGPLHAGEPVVIEDTTEAAKMSARLPGELSDMPELAAKLGRQAGRQIRAFADRAAEAHEQSDRQDQWRKWSLEIEHEVTFENPRVVSVLRRTWFYTGGAHGNVGLDSLIYDRQMEAFIGLDDLFGPVKDGAPVLETIAAYARNSLIERLGQASDRAWIRDGTAPKRATYEAFTLVPSGEPNKAGGIAVHFGPYAVAPYAAGPQRVVIPQGVLSDNLTHPWRKLFAGSPESPGSTRP